jgi:hypothetical protein
MSRCKEHFWAELGGGFFRCSWCGDRKTKEEIKNEKKQDSREKECDWHDDRPPGSCDCKAR